MSKNVTLRLADEDYLTLKEKAEELKIPMSDLIKHCVHDKYGVGLTISRLEVRTGNERKELLEYRERYFTILKMFMGLEAKVNDIIGSIKGYQDWRSRFVYTNDTVELEVEKTGETVRVNQVYFVKIRRGGISNGEKRKTKERK